MSKASIVITGIGMVTPLGNTTNSTWENIKAGVSGITDLRADMDLGDYYYHIGGKVRGEQDALDAILDKNIQKKTDRFIHLAVMAGHEAITTSGITNSGLDPRRIGVFMGVGVGGAPSLVTAATECNTSGIKRVSPFAIPKILNNLAASWLSMQWNFQGPCMAITNACSSSADAIGLAMQQLQLGIVDAMVVGGAESCLIPLAIGGFGNMRALSSWTGDPKGASRPFNADRSGFVMAEGAAVLVLEHKERAVARGANIIAEVVGYTATADAYHITSMHPDGRGAVAAMQDALAFAGIMPSDVGYLNAHGTSTVLGDVTETLVIKQVFGSHADQTTNNHLLVSSTKSMTGHLLGAAGSMEAAFCALALQDQIVPPTINLDTPDPACDLDYVPHASRAHSFSYAVSNSFGFGGGNAVLVLKRA